MFSAIEYIYWCPTGLATSSHFTNVLFPSIFSPVFGITIHFVTEILDVSLPLPPHFLYPAFHSVLLIQTSIIPLISAVLLCLLHPAHFNS